MLVVECKSGRNRCAGLAEPSADFFPVGAMPVELSALLATEVFVHPPEGFRGNLLAVLFFFHPLELAPAAHAPRIAGRQVQFNAKKFKLLMFRNRRGHPKGADFAMSDCAAIEEKAIGGHNQGLEQLSLADQFAIADILNPKRFATRGAKPARQTTQTSIANDAGQTWLDLSSAPVERLDLPRQIDVDPCECAAYVQIFAGCLRMSFGEQESDTLFPIPGSNLREQFAKAPGEGSGNSAHASSWRVLNRRATDSTL